MIKFIISGLALAGIVVHLIWPSLKIDAITLGLFIVLFLPWLGHVFKSFEFPGGWKVEYQDVQRVGDQVESAGLFAAAEEYPSTLYSFQTIADIDPNLALAGLRIEIEKKLSQLAQSRGLPTNRASIGQLLRELNGRQLINGSERAALSDLTALLNSAVHGAIVDPRAASWAFEQGPRILAALENRIESSDVQYKGIT